MPSLAPFGQAVSEEKIFLTLANQKKELILATMFVGQMEPQLPVAWDYPFFDI
jgi:selenophosphate synthetase-related protein